MRCLIVYDTITGNTEKIARAIASVLKARIAKAGKAGINEISKYSLIGFGSGIYATKHHQSLLRLVDKMPENIGNNKKAFVFSTAGTCSLKLLWHLPLRKRLIKKGFEVAGEFCCKGKDTFGPFKLIGGLNKNHPNEEDIKNAKEFAKSIKMQVK